MLVHLVVIVLFLYMHHSPAYITSIVLNKNIDCSRPILFIPRGIQPCSLSTAKKSITKTTAPQQAIHPKTSTKISTPIAPKTALEAQPKKVVDKKLATTDSTQNVPPIPEKPMAEIPVPHKEVIPEKKPEIIQKTPAMATPSIPDNALISHDYKEAEALRRHAELHNAITKQWKQPLGVSPNSSCDIAFFVNKKGAIENLVIQKSSGVLMYDTSARHALYSTTMPRWTYGKQIIINFN